MQAGWRDQRGAALVTVLLFMVLTFVLITSMLAVTGNEAVIAGLHRDSVRALDMAQAGLNEAARRIEEGRPYKLGFTSSLNPNTTVTVTRRFLGSNAAFHEITSTATVGRSTRRISTLVLQYMVSMPPNILFGDAVSEVGQSNVSSGEVYSRHYVQYREGEYTSSNRRTYSAWRTSKCVDPEKSPASACKPVEYPAKIQPCYTHAQCVALGPDTANWYPGTRRGESEDTALGQDITAQMNKCPAGGGGALPLDLVPAGAIAATGVPIGGQPLYGFDRDDLTWNGIPVPPQAVSADLPCGLPYKWVQETFDQEKTTEPQVTRWFKTIVFEQWFNNYWQFDPGQLTVTKKPALNTYPEFGAVPPRVDVSGDNADQEVVGGGVIDESSGIDYGCKSPEMACPGGVSRPILLHLKGPSSWTISGNVFGHGTIVVDGDVVISGNFEYWGTIVVKGNATVILGAGNVKIHGGMVTQAKTELGGNTLVEGGTTIPNVPTGDSVVVGKAWWER